MLSIAGLREKSPFPTVIEVLMMEVMFEGLREAGIRLPKQIGPLVSIVGAVVIGEVAVRAGIISSPIVIVVSVSWYFILCHSSVSIQHSDENVTISRVDSVRVIWALRHCDGHHRDSHSPDSS